MYTGMPALLYTALVYLVSSSIRYPSTGTLLSARWRRAGEHSAWVCIAWCALKREARPSLGTAVPSATRRAQRAADYRISSKHLEFLQSITSRDSGRWWPVDDISVLRLVSILIHGALAFRALTF